MLSQSIHYISVATLKSWLGSQNELEYIYLSSFCCYVYPLSSHSICNTMNAVNLFDVYKPLSLGTEINLLTSGSFSII